MDERQNIIDRYKKRESLPSRRYLFTSPWMYMHEQEKERAILILLRNAEIQSFNNKTILEIGCGNGINILNFIKYGFKPKNIVGNELIGDRIKNASEILHKDVKLVEGNALDLDFEDGSFDIVYQSLVFSSILDMNFQDDLAKKMWRLVKGGGGILWYDFIYNNPKNKDVRGVNFKRIKQLFPAAEIIKYKISLAPPLARVVSNVHYKFYNIFNSMYFLRTHILCWIKKNVI